MWIVLFPLMNPTTCATEYFGGIEQHVDVVGHQVPFLDPALPLSGQLPENVTEFMAQLPVQDLAPILRDEDYVVLALPNAVVQTL